MTLLVERWKEVGPPEMSLPSPRYMEKYREYKNFQKNWRGFLNRYAYIFCQGSYLSRLSKQFLCT